MFFSTQAFMDKIVEAFAPLLLGLVLLRGDRPGPLLGVWLVGLNLMDICQTESPALIVPRIVASLRLCATHVSTTTYKAALAGEGTISAGSDVPRVAPRDWRSLRRAIEC